MATLNKLLVYVPASLCDSFKTKYVDGTDATYNSKVVFLEKTREIFTNGKLFGTNLTDFNALKALVGTLPAGATSTNIVDYITEAINNANYISSVSKKNGETLIDVTTSGKAVTINSSSSLTSAVSKANSAVQNVTILGHKLSNGGSVTVDQAKTDLGLGSAAYENKTAFDAAGAASNVQTALIGYDKDNSEANTIKGAKKYADSVAASKASEVQTAVLAKLPVVAQGKGIVVTPTTNDGKTTYTVSTSAEVFHYKGNKTAMSQLPASGNETGDVWSVGAENASGSTLYAWDGDEWINIGGANGVTGVDTTASSGVSLARNSNGTVKVNVATGSVASGNTSLVTGGAVYTAISAAEGRCETKGTAQNLINGLGGSASSTNGTYVNVSVSTSKGQVSTVSVTETTALKNAISNVGTAVQTVNGDSPYLTTSKSGTTVTLNLDETEVFNYVVNNIWETYSRYEVDINP